MPNKYESRFADAECVRFDAGDDGVVSGYAVVFDKPANIGGMFTEYVDRGAIDENVLKDVQFLVNHNGSGITLARSRNNNENSTMQLKVDENGLFIRAKLDIENNAEARSLYSAIKRGDVSGMSFCFSVENDNWKDLKSKNPIRHITKIGYIREVSAVNSPAYPDTSIQARSADAEGVLENARAAVETVGVSALDLEKAKIKNRLI